MSCTGKPTTLNTIIKQKGEDDVRYFLDATTRPSGKYSRLVLRVEKRI